MCNTKQPSVEVLVILEANLGAIPSGKGFLIANAEGHLSIGSRCLFVCRRASPLISWGGSRKGSISQVFHFKVKNKITSGTQSHCDALFLA